MRHNDELDKNSETQVTGVIKFKSGSMKKEVPIKGTINKESNSIIIEDPSTNGVIEWRTSRRIPMSAAISWRTVRDTDN